MKKGIKLQTKTQMSMIFIIVFVVVVIFLIGQKVNKVNDEVVSIREKDLERSFASLEIACTIGEMQVAVEQYVGGNSSSKEGYETSHKEYQKRIGAFGNIDDTHPTYKDVQLVKQQVNAYHQQVSQLFHLYIPEQEVDAKAKIERLVAGEYKSLTQALSQVDGQVKVSNRNNQREYYEALGAHGQNMQLQLQRYLADASDASKLFGEEAQLFEEAYTKLMEKPIRGAEEALGKVKEHFDRLQGQAAEAFALYEPSSKVKARAIQEKMSNEEYAVLKEAIGRISVENTAETKAILTTIVDDLQGMKQGITQGIIIIIMMGILSRMVVKYVIIRPINKLSDNLQSIAEGEGDLTVQISARSKDEIGALSYYFNGFVAKLRELMKSVIESTDGLLVKTEAINTSVAGASEAMVAIGGYVQGITSVLQENAAVVQETAASIEEITSSAAVVSERAEEVVRASNHVLGVAEDGSAKLAGVRDVFEKVQQSSNEIKGTLESLVVHSKDIGKVVEIITGIADQVNLLSLNASIEAARAGEYGMGFAVVADEIRKLAEESRKSARGIEEILLQITDKTEEVSVVVEKERHFIAESNQHMEETEIAFLQILESTRDVGERMTRIAHTIEAQSEATDEVSKAINEMSVGAQEGAETITNINDYVEQQVALLKGIKQAVDESQILFADLTSQTSKFKI
ncbi:MAG: methyl-accepting chemotaxis protein [Cellulosilyticaceae bacterium]